MMSALEMSLLLEVDEPLAPSVLFLSPMILIKYSCLLRAPKKE